MKRCPAAAAFSVRPRTALHTSRRTRTHEARRCIRVSDSPAEFEPERRSRERREEQLEERREERRAERRDDRRSVFSDESWFGAFSSDDDSTLSDAALGDLPSEKPVADPEAAYKSHFDLPPVPMAPAMNVNADADAEDS